jgi:hypothetical protein
MPGVGKLTIFRQFLFLDLTGDVLQVLFLGYSISDRTMVD